MIIEFTGPPGSGKTHLSKLLADYLKRELEPKGYQIITTQMLIQKNGRWLSMRVINGLKTMFNFFSVADGQLMLTLLASCMRRGRFREKISSLKYAISILAIYRYIAELEQRETSRFVFVLEEGLFHLSVSLLPGTGGEFFLNDFFVSVGRNKQIGLSRARNTIIFVDSELEKNIVRIDRRKQGWPSAISHLSAEKKHQALAQSFRKSQTAKKFAFESGFSAVEIDNSTFRTRYMEFEQIKRRIEMHEDER